MLRCQYIHNLVATVFPSNLVLMASVQWKMWYHKGFQSNSKQDTAKCFVLINWTNQP